MGICLKPPGLALLLAAAVAFLPLSAALGAEGGVYRELSAGTEGEDVTALKLRLFDLGYYSTSKVSDAFTADTARKVKRFQELNGLEATGTATPDMQEILFSPQAVPRPLPESVPWQALAPSAGPVGEPDLPQTGPGGFLQEPSAEPYVYADEADGRWIYIGAALRVDIRRYRQAAGQLEWYEADIRSAEGNLPRATLSKDGGGTFELPLSLARRAGAVFAVTDDFFAYRARYGQRVGIVVRGGEVLSDRTYAQDRSRIPSLEVLALFEDGSLKTFDSDAHSGAEYLRMGVTDTWAFGPVLVREGEVPRYYYSDDYRSYREPRCAFGEAGPGHYLALVVTGRRDNSRGAYFGWMAEKMKEMGAVEALNLDGGNTVALVFMGAVLNKYDGTNQESNRKVSGLIAFSDAAR